jgi:hypothetical protein
LQAPPPGVLPESPRLEVGFFGFPRSEPKRDESQKSNATLPVRLPLDRLPLLPLRRRDARTPHHELTGNALLVLMSYVIYMFAQSRRSRRPRDSSTRRGAAR